MADFEVVERGEWDGKVEVFGNVAFRRFKLMRQQVLPGHTHKYAHGSVVISGELLLILAYEDGRKNEKVYKGGDAFEVPAEAYHQIRAVSETVEWYCLFAVRDDLGEPVAKVLPAHLVDMNYAQ